jgi:enoyl-CoA hydratase/carnithine racemase
MQTLVAALDAVAVDESVRSVVISGAPPVFCAGHDLLEMSEGRKHGDGGKAFFEETFALCSQLMLRIVTLPQPVIAAIEGIATAAGCQLVATCDLAVAGASSRFSTPGVHIGLFCSTPMVALSRNVSRKQAMHMLLTGEMANAQTARDIGLLNNVVDDGTAQDAAVALAHKIAQKSTRTVRFGKEAFYRQIEMPLAQAYDFTAAVMTANMMDDDAAEGIAAFLEKRNAVWKQDRG